MALQQRQRSLESLKNEVADALTQSRALGADAAEASASFATGLSVNVRMREVETLEYQRDQGLGLTVYFGHRKGNASTSDLSPAAIQETVEKACALARYAAEDEAAGLADAHRLAREIPDLDLDHPWDIEPSAAIDLATRCESAALDFDSRISNSEGASVSTHRSWRVYGNSNDFLEGYADTSHNLSCAVLAAGPHGMERDYEYTVSRRADRLEDPVHVGQEAARRAIDRLGADKLTTRSCPVLFPARLARGLLGHMLGAISGGNLYRRSSFLLEALGQPVFGDWVDIEERPHIAGALGSAAFDDEGVATADRFLVRQGVLQGYVLGSYYARKLGLETTGNAGGIHNLEVTDSGQTFDQLMNQMDTGLLLTELMGSGVNMVTGDYSRGAAGFWVQGGEIQYPVSEVTVAGNLSEMYRNIQAIGTDRDLRGVIRMGSTLVEGMTVAGS